MLWGLHPVRVLIVVFLDVFRGLQAVMSSGNYACMRLCRLIATELCRVAVESLVDALATHNEAVVQASARFAMEYRQMEQRVRMDVPTLADPAVRDLFHESDLFVRSFSGVSSFGLLSPLDLLRVLTLLSELASHALVLLSLAAAARGTPAQWALLVGAASALAPLLAALVCAHAAPPCGYEYEDARGVRERRAAAKQERMRALAQSDAFRPEVALFGLAPWILQNWAKSRRHVLGLDGAAPPDGGAPSVLSAVYQNAHLGSLSAALQNIPLVLVLQSSSASLGSFTLYRSSVQSLVFTARALSETLRLAFQGVFLMGAFCAAMEVQPRLQPSKEALIRYKSSGKGMKIEARNISYTYPGSHTPALRDVTFTLEAGERLAIVGCNGSGKSTLANVLLRITDFHGGTLLLNGRDLARHAPGDVHERATAVFQGFARFEGSLRLNVGVGYVPDMRAPASVEKAVRLAGAAGVVGALPCGMKTVLDAGAGAFGEAGCAGAGAGERRQVGLSGGEWQRVALSRAFMRATRPEVELIVLDEPTSALDAHAQSKIFDTVEQLSTGAGGERTKTVVFITHRLSTARRADKIAMLEHGTITEFGTHQELLQRDGPYAALYRASV
ncbi:hypothetical protein EIP86_005653 [Pleurotus ostreatoroseus]|nr:hypothetical protein EIP86_005653 [Pleurotus ostreatoroseus]